MKKILTAVAISIAIPAAAHAQTGQAPAAKPAQAKAPMCMDHSKMAGMNMSGMEHSKMPGMNMPGMDMQSMDHSKMMAECATNSSKAGSTPSHEGHGGH